MKAKILVAESDAAIRKLIKTALECCGYRVVEAEDKESCLKLTGSEEIDVIILDCLGQKTDGISTLRHLRSDRDSSGIPVIVMTGMGQYSYDLGILATSCLPKPFRPAHLINKVEAALAGGLGHRLQAEKIPEMELQLVNG